jgi:hypothetical protein
MGRSWNKTGCCHTSSKHGIQEKHPSVSNILGQLIVEKLRLGRFLVTLDQDLSNTNRAAAVAETLLHGLTSSHDRHTADLALEHETIVGTANRRSDSMLNDRQMVKTLLDKQTNNSVGVENEVCSLRLFATDHPGHFSAPRHNLGVDARLGKWTYDSRAIS